MRALGRDLVRDLGPLHLAGDGLHDLAVHREGQLVVIRARRHRPEEPDHTGSLDLGGDPGGLPGRKGPTLDGVGSERIVVILREPAGVSARREPLRAIHRRGDTGDGERPDRPHRDVRRAKLVLLARLVVANAIAPALELEAVPHQSAASGNRNGQPGVLGGRGRRNAGIRSVAVERHSPELRLPLRRQSQRIGRNLRLGGVDDAVVPLPAIEVPETPGRFRQGAERRIHDHLAGLLGNGSPVGVESDHDRRPEGELVDPAAVLAGTTGDVLGIGPAQRMGAGRGDLVRDLRPVLLAVNRLNRDTIHGELQLVEHRFGRDGPEEGHHARPLDAGLEPGRLAVLDRPAADRLVAGMDLVGRRIPRRIAATHEDIALLLALQRLGDALDREGPDRRQRQVSRRLADRFAGMIVIARGIAPAGEDVARPAEVRRQLGQDDFRVDLGGHRLRRLAGCVSVADEVDR